MRTTDMPETAASLPPLSPRHWPSTAVLATLFVLYLVAGLSLSGMEAPDGDAVARATLVPVSKSRPAAPPPSPRIEPLAFRDIAPQDAAQINAAIPVSTAANPAARAFIERAATAADRTRALECLTAAVYYEAGSESADGQRAVAQVVLNRVRHPAYPNSVCGVVFEGAARTTGCQFTFTCDGSLRRTPSVAGWERARKVAAAALSGKVYKPVGYSTHYHTNWVVPYWSANLVKAANVGAHIFYRWTGGWGRPPAFANSHSGSEPEVGLMRPLTSDPATLAGASANLPASGLARALEAGALATRRSGENAFQRAIVRRYEPVSRQGVAALVDSQARTGQAVDSSYRWAMTGDGPGAAEKPLGGRGGEAPPAKTCDSTVTTAATC